MRIRRTRRKPPSTITVQGHVYYGKKTDRAPLYGVYIILYLHKTPIEIYNTPGIMICRRHCGGIFTLNRVERAITEDANRYIINSVINALSVLHV